MKGNKCRNEKATGRESDSGAPSGGRFFYLKVKYHFFSLNQILLSLVYSLIHLSSISLWAWTQGWSAAMTTPSVSHSWQQQPNKNRTKGCGSNSNNDNSDDIYIYLKNEITKTETERNKKKKWMIDRYEFECCGLRAVGGERWPERRVLHRNAATARAILLAPTSVADSQIDGARGREVRRRRWQYHEEDDNRDPQEWMNDYPPPILLPPSLLPPPPLPPFPRGVGSGHLGPLSRLFTHLSISLALLTFINIQLCVCVDGCCLRIGGAPLCPLYWTSYCILAPATSGRFI